MPRSWTTAIDIVEIPPERDAIVGAIGRRDRLDAKVGTAIGEYQALGLHEVDGPVTMGSRLRHRAAMDPVTATRWARRAAKLHQMPEPPANRAPGPHRCARCQTRSPGG